MNVFPSLSQPHEFGGISPNGWYQRSEIWKWKSISINHNTPGYQQLRWGLGSHREIIPKCHKGETWMWSSFSKWHEKSLVAKSTEGHCMGLFLFGQSSTLARKGTICCFMRIMKRSPRAWKKWKEAPEWELGDLGSCLSLRSHIMWSQQVCFLNCSIWRLDLMDPTTPVPYETLLSNIGTRLQWSSSGHHTWNEQMWVQMLWGFPPSSVMIMQSHTKTEMAIKWIAII